MQKVQERDSHEDMEKIVYQNFGVIGAGAFGTALAMALRRAGRDVVLWAHEAACADGINSRNENALYLPGVALDSAIHATCDLAATGTADVLLLVAPAQRLRDVARRLAATGAVRASTPVIIAAKGIERETTKFLSDAVAEEMPGHEIAVLSGPSFAIEVAKDLPVALTLAARDQTLAVALRDAVASRHVRIYDSNDIVGVQIGGAVKNVLAIASGIVTGRGLGESARAALVTRALKELVAFGVALGAREETLMGLSGLGDLLLTCSSPQSRNMSLGIALGRGERLDAILAQRTAVTEGVWTANAALKLASQHGVDMPITEAVDAVLGGRTDIDRAIADLMTRPLKAEAR